MTMSLDLGQVTSSLDSPYYDKSTSASDASREITSAEHREVRALCGFDAARMAMPPPPGASPQGTSSRRYIDLTPDSPKFAPLPFPKV